MRLLPFIIAFKDKTIDCKNAEKIWSFFVYVSKHTTLRLKNTLPTKIWEAHTIINNGKIVFDPGMSIFIKKKYTVTDSDGNGGIGSFPV